MLNSLALRTNLMMDKYHTVINESPEFISVKTPSRPDYFWGNYIICKNEQSLNTYRESIEAFEKLIGKKSELGFIAITFDWTAFEISFFDEFIENGFELEVSRVLSTDKVDLPPKINKEIQIKEIDLNGNLDFYVDVQFSSNWGYGNDEIQKKFLKDNIEEFAALSQKMPAKRFGAYLNDEIIAELGVYWENGIARFNNVGTHKDYRRIGACSTLVYEVSKTILEREDVSTLVMEADDSYHAAGIYESVGFKPTEKLASLEWRDSKKFKS